MGKTYVKSYGRCKWMGFVAAFFIVLTIACMIPGAIGVAGLNHYNDTLLYLSLIDLLFAGIFFVGWWTCQIETEDVVFFERDIPVRIQPKHSGSISSQGSNSEVDETDSNPKHELIKLKTKHSKQEIVDETLTT
uniref:Uncharacterized LOC100180714 n=1 Tax=Ciona intestinalis TaxID=7719 RepID=F6V4W9_CIOIN|nr:uncharacterized protein LOC100180714 [Ciona intestinalis]|eukprot:XP_002131519.1 uncharacterized protein LOC100180714 [Ciona intestinalis]